MTWLRIASAPQPSWMRGDVITKAAPDEYIAYCGFDYLGTFDTLEAAQAACDRHAPSGGVWFALAAFVVGVLTGICAGWV